MSTKLEGGCLCGAIAFEVVQDFKAFYHCHCSQCQTLTGSAFASNLFTHPDNIDWLKGESFIIKYEHPEREFSKSFCKVCGSSVPFINKRKSSLIIPAGSLSLDVGVPLEANIFVTEKVCRLTSEEKVKNYDYFPE